MSSLNNDDFWADTLWQRSVIAARDPGLFDAWKRWIHARK
jgi:myo-inositol-1(or 4)-monophosphatase